MAVEELKNDPMMAHLLQSLEAHKDIGHYGRLVFAMVARHFLDDDELMDLLARNPGFGQDQARALIRQVESRDYNPPRRERIIEWARKQEFPICPNPDDPDACNIYKNLQLPSDVYEYISEYHESKVRAEQEP
jgi:hypothetical protein